MRKLSPAIALAAALVCAAPAMALTLTFDSPVVTGSSQAPGVWYTDRYAPAGFQTAFFDGDNRLKHSISAADAASLRPSGFSSAFYDT